MAPIKVSKKGINKGKNTFISKTPKESEKAMPIMLKSILKQYKSTDFFLFSVNNNTGIRAKEYTGK